MTRDKLFHPEYAAELLQIARGDLESAKLLASNLAVGRKENVCFNAQQAIEKSLKALICHLGQPIPLTHTVELLIDRLPQEYRPSNTDALIELTDFATVRRYHEGNEIITAQDIEAVILLASNIVEFVAQKLYIRKQS